MKSILLPIHPDAGQEARLQASLDLARRFNGHITCLQMAPLGDFVAIEPYGISYVSTQAIDELQNRQKDERSALEERLRGEGVAWDWIAEAGTPEMLIPDYGWLSDLVVMNLPEKDDGNSAYSVPSVGSAVVRTRAPLLTVPKGSRSFDSAAPALIAWNGSPESCVAMKAALPLLRTASAVKLITVIDDEPDDFSATAAAAYLSRHGIASEIVETSRGSAPVSDTLLDTAAGLKAGLLVMGAFGHSRLRENIFGGVTRGMLDKANLPLLLAH